MDRSLVVKQQHSLQQQISPTIITTTNSERPWYSLFSVNSYSSILHQPLVSSLGSVFAPSSSSSLERTQNPSWWSTIYRLGTNPSTVVQINDNRNDTSNSSLQQPSVPVYVDVMQSASSILDNDSSLSTDSSSVNNGSCVSSLDCSSLISTTSTTPPISPVSPCDELMKDQQPKKQHYPHPCQHLVISMLWIWLCGHVVVQVVLVTSQPLSSPTTTNNDVQPSINEPVPLTTPRRDSKFEDEVDVKNSLMLVEEKAHVPKVAEPSSTWAPFTESDTISRYAAKRPAVADLWQQHERHLEAYRRSFPIRPTERRKYWRSQQQPSTSSSMQNGNNDKLMALANETLAYFENTYANNSSEDHHLDDIIHTLRYRAFASSSSTSTSITNNTTI
ncbi:hypothetical protein O0I10_005979 [Lichtheimia ornata]|uniref:Uncharacterized protein n=1 Tax=Lichtheimia ornata TaxID=688661 RepID=A0AAD7XZ77_9FUNG|nr:uncharacterized protein O0I10_005979 [Lichtheimia ornata]KAJ8658296.1 hypothetical protein O0I10_005979 [Lichtheimia ornata]